MNTVERDTEREYKEWCEKNADFLKRYVAELLDERKDSIEKVINEHIESEIKKCLSRMTKEELEKVLRHPKTIEEWVFSDQFRARLVSDYVKDYNSPRYRGYNIF